MRSPASASVTGTPTTFRSCDDAVKTESMSAQAADLIETNFVEFLLSMGRAGGAVERLDDEIAWTIGGSPIGYHNAVVRCTFSLLAP